MSDYKETTTATFATNAIPLGRNLSNMAKTMQKSLKGTLQEDKIRIKMRYGIVQDDAVPLPVYIEAYEDEFSLFYLKGVNRADMLIVYVTTDGKNQVVGGTLAPFHSNGLDKIS